MHAKTVSALKGNDVCFLNCRENQVNGDSTRTNKLKLQYKVVAKVQFRHVHFVSPTVQFTVQDIFLSLLFLGWITTESLFRKGDERPDTREKQTYFFFFLRFCFSATRGGSPEKFLRY